MAMSTSCSENGEEAEKIRELVKESFELAAKVCFGDVLGPLKRLGFWVDGKQLMDVTMGMINFWRVKQHEERAEREGWDREDKDLMDILLKAYQDDKAEVKISRTHVKAFLLRSKFSCEPTMRATANNGSYRDRRSMKHVLDKVHGYIYLEPV
ncbi:unnamed protein product [Prunus armeniaca]|uniref:Uncharacterized protein n=1 Tax=Prunus armeniaca TaxID=36596 RepID=A0A6J5UAZ8_PRUAR|nr:unnamed protein product [Prunus armeniaca]